MTEHGEVQRDEQDEELALRLIEAWVGSLGDDEDGEATGEMIDLLEVIPANEPYDEQYERDPRLRSLFGLIANLNAMMVRYGAAETEPEHLLVLNAFNEAMRLLAAELSERGYHIKVPEVTLP
jgi:hypothetical protein